MIENNLLKSNFLGRDGFRWWVGQIAPESAQGKQINGAGWGNRAKVRILGYHPDQVIMYLVFLWTVMMLNNL